MMRTLFKWTVLSLSLFNSTTVLAVATLPCGWYLEGSYGATSVSNEDYSGITSEDNNGQGWNLNAGYKFMKYLAVDVGYTSYDATRLKNSEGTTVAQVQHYSINGAVKGIFPLWTTGVELFAKLGVSYLNSSVGNIDDTAAAVDGLVIDSDTKTSTGPYGGVGVSYALAPEISVLIEGTRAFGSSSSTGQMNLISAGLNWIL